MGLLRQLRERQRLEALDQKGAILPARGLGLCRLQLRAAPPCAQIARAAGHRP